MIQSTRSKTERPHEPLQPRQVSLQLPSAVPVSPPDASRKALSILTKLGNLITERDVSDPETWSNNAVAIKNQIDKEMNEIQRVMPGSPFLLLDKIRKDTMAYLHHVHETLNTENPRQGSAYAELYKGSRSVKDAMERYLDNKALFVGTAVPTDPETIEAKKIEIDRLSALRTHYENIVKDFTARVPMSVDLIRRELSDMAEVTSELQLYIKQIYEEIDPAHLMKILQEDDPGFKARQLQEQIDALLEEIGRAHV